MNKKKRIGIISCDGWLRLWDNYGTLFQNYALQTYLQKLGYETFWIQTTVEARRLSLKDLLNAVKRFPRIVYSRTIGRVRAWIEHQRISKFNSAHPRRFDDFLSGYVPRTSEFYSDSRLLESPPPAFAYVVGSDQIWGGVSVRTFLGFGNTSARRIAYAVSTAWKIRSPEWMTAASKMISNFDAVSVREPEGVDVCKRIGRKDVKHVVDPTLLLEKEDYMKIVRKESVDNPFFRKTVLAYYLNVKSLSDLPWAETLEFTRGRGADLKVVPLQGSEFAIPEEFVFTPSPAGWLNAYDKADCILTNSFHGTVFAIIMRKPFLVILQKGQTEAENCRFLSILKRLGLEDRIFFGGLMEDVMSNPINWSDVSAKLNAWREESMTFLTKSLS